MNSLQQVLNDYQNYAQTCANLLKGWQPAGARAVKLERSRQELDGPALQQTLQQAGPVQGWLLLASERVVLNNQPVSTLGSRLLAADLYAGGVSLRIRELDDKQWLLVRLQINECEPEQASHLAIAVSHLAAEEGVKKLAYQQLWCQNPHGHLHIDDAVFTGFEGA